jgi:hypothetical protein
MGTTKIYEIRVEGHLSSSWSSWFEGLIVRHEASGETVLCGPIVDQAALHGVLMRIRDLSLPLVAVRRVSQTNAQTSDCQATEKE